MLTLSEETMLLLYWRMGAGSPDEYDGLARYGGDMRMLAGAALMDFVLLGKVQVQPVSPGTRRLTAGSVVPLVMAVVFILAALWAHGIHWPTTRGTAGIIIAGFLAGFVLMTAIGATLGRVLGDRLTIVDRTPTGDPALDEAFARVERVGQHGMLRRYVRAFGLRRLPRLAQALKAQLERKGLLSPATPVPGIFGFPERRHVRRERPEFAAIGEHVRRLVLDHTEADTHAVALLLLFAWSRRVLSVGKPVASGVYQFFAPDEYPRLRAFLRALRRGDATPTAQINPDLYQALRAIAAVVQQMRLEDTSGGGWA